MHFRLSYAQTARRLFCLIATLAGALSAHADHYTRLLKDIGQFAISSDPQGLAALGNRVFFNAQDGENGQELWVSDGTQQGTYMIQDLQVGSGASDPSGMTAFNGYVYMRAHGSGGEGSELWRTDGTPDSFELIKDINPAGSSNPVEFVAAGSKLFFRADDGPHGKELWVTDGTEGGTMLVKDINPDDGDSNPVALVALNDLLLFVADDGANGRELWVSDGTEGGTFMIDLNGASEGAPGNLARVGNYIYFTAQPGGLWRTDGTELGTEELLWMDTTRLTSIGQIVDFNGNVAFASSTVGGSELWMSDGTGNGTYRVKDIRPGGSSSGPSDLTVAGAQLFFVADDGTHGEELWVTDGTEEGTVMTRDVAPDGLDSYPNELVALGNKVIYSCETPDEGYEVFVSDGTENGTFLLKDIYPGTDSSYADDFAVAGDTCFFTADDAAHGEELWKTDGTSNGTVLAAVINDTANGSGVDGITTIDGVAYFQADNGNNGSELWMSDGTFDGTIMVRDIDPGSQGSGPFGFTPFAGEVFFRASGNNGGELWKTDGTFDGTVEVANIRAGQNSSNPYGFAVLNNTLVFIANDGVDGTEVWYSDGTGGGTQILKDINPDEGHSFPEEIEVVGTYGLFSADDGTNGRELWKTDGTPGGTELVLDINGSGDSNPAHITAYGTMALFAADNGVDGVELMKTTGAVGNATLVKNIASGATGSEPQDLIEINGLVYFSADDGTNGRELWVTDGTSGNTVMVADIFPGSGSSNPDELVDLNGMIVFVAQPDVGNRELWISDGTELGTHQIADVRQGGASSSSQRLTVINNRVYFSAIGNLIGEDYGRELWVTDGTEEGTHRVEDINPEDGDGNPYRMTGLGEFVLFSADNGLFGPELWITQAGAPEVASITATGSLDANSETVEFAVEFTEPVTGVDESDFAPDAAAKVVTGASIASVSGSGASYTVSVETGTGEGLLGLALVDDDSIAAVAAPMLPLSGRDGNDATQASTERYAIDRQAPVVTVTAIITGNDTPTLRGTVDDTNATVSISVDGQTAQANVQFDGDWVVFGGPISGLTEGFYNVVATATDTAGNAAIDGTTDELLVDLTPPTAALIGPAYVQLFVGDTYVDLGATGEDNFDDMVDIEAGGLPLDTSAEGYFSVFYQAVDDAGNRSTAVFRTVDVALPGGGSTGLINPSTGGTVEIPTGPLRNGQINIPPFALTDPTTIGIESAQNPPMAPPGWRLIFAINLTPEGLVMNGNPAEVFLPWLSPPSDDPVFFVAYYDPAEQDWFQDGITDAEYNALTDTLHFRVAKLMTYGVFVLGGDVNGDGAINAVDVQLVINAALGLTITGDANVDGDSQNLVNAVDVQIVINQALGVF